MNDADKKLCSQFMEIVHAIEEFDGYENIDTETLYALICDLNRIIAQASMSTDEDVDGMINLMQVFHRNLEDELAEHSKTHLYDLYHVNII